MVYIIGLLTGLAVLLLFTAFVMPGLEKRQYVKQRLRPYEPRTIALLNEKYKQESGLSAQIIKKLNAVSQKMSRQGNRTDRNEKTRKETEKDLYSAGIDMPVETWYLIRYTLIFAGLFAGLFVAAEKVGGDYSTIVMLLCFGLPLIGTRFFLKSRIKGRSKQMDRQLPDVLDLLAIAVDAGMGFDQALQYVITDMQGPLIDELIITAREMSFGKTRVEAFDSLSERCNHKSISNFCSAVTQATKSGIPIRNVLQSQAVDIREDHMSAVEQKAAKASIRMILPMVGFIFPTIFIVLLGPAALSLIDNLL